MHQYKMESQEGLRVIALRDEGADAALGQGTVTLVFQTRLSERQRVRI